MMDETRFWAMIAASWPKTKQMRRFQREVMAGEMDDIDAIDDLQDNMLEVLRAQLNQLDAAGLLAFDRILERKLYDIDRASSALQRCLPSHRRIGYYQQIAPVWKRTHRPSWM